jgi:hypothetical protein
MNAPISPYRRELAPAREEFSAEKALEVLSTPFGASPSEDLAALKVQLPVLADASVSSTQYHRLLDLFYTRTQKLSAHLKPHLRDASLPLTREIRNLARDLSETYRAIAAGYRWVLANMGQQRGGDNPMRNAQALMGRAMKCLAEQLEVSGLTAAPQPGGVWHAAYQLYLEATNETMEEASSVSLGAEQVFREMLALSTASPESLSSREVSLVAEYASIFAASVVVHDAPPAAVDQDVSLYWIDIANDQAPYAVVRRTPPFGMNQILYFSCARLADVVENQLRGLENGFQPKDLRLPDSASDPGYHALLRRLMKRWREPPKRQFPRRRNNYQMQLCPGFDAFWRLLEQQDQGMPVLDVGMVSDWMVVNESPAGYALMHTSGTVDNLQNGSVVALRTKAGQPWEVCIVRWMTSENPEHIELGVQVVAHGAQPVRVGFRGVKNASLQPGLLLEPVTALRSKRAILTVAGTCRSRRFVMISGASKLYVAQGDVLSLDLQTASIELFQFDPDHNPV